MNKNSEMFSIYLVVVLVVSLAICLGGYFYFEKLGRIPSQSGSLSLNTIANFDNQNIGTEERLYLPIDVTRITNSGSLIFKYVPRGDERSILYLIGGKRINELQNPTGNIGLIYPDPITPRQRVSTREWTPEAELIITRCNGTVERYSLPIVGGEICS